MSTDETVNVRYMVDDVAAAIDFYTTHFGFKELSSVLPMFADVSRGNLRLLLSGPKSSAGRAMPDGARPGPGGWNRIHLVTSDLDGEIARLEGGWSDVPQRRRHRTGRVPDPDPGPSRQPRRTVPARQPLAAARHQTGGTVDQATSNRSSIMTLSHAATKSRTNFSFESSHA